MNISQKKDIIVFVELAPREAIDAIKRDMPFIKTLLLRDSTHKTADKGKDFPVEYVEYVDFTKESKIAIALLPYMDRLRAITARGEAGASRLEKVVPHVPYLRTPNPESLRWATDKYEMRKRLNLYNKKITPKFTKIKDTTKKERARVIEKVGFPMVVKPANLEQSKLVTICFHEEELEKVTRNIFRKLKSQYSELHRLQEPTVMAEAYMEGDMYSIDSYVDARGRVWHCPLVRVKTGRDIGHDDFYNYQQITPTALKQGTVERAQMVAESTIHALGLRSVTAHIELMKLDDEWKVIEVGPRIGGFRPLLYKLSCDIDHSLNDIYIRIPKNPVIPKKCKGYACAMKWFADKEGEITEMKGIKKIEGLESFNSITINKKIGDRATFARNGGKSVFNVFLYHQDRSQLLADIRRLEKMVIIKISQKRDQTPKKGVTKKVAKKTT